MSALARLLDRRREVDPVRERDIVRDGLSKAREDFAHDLGDVAEVEAEAEFWLSVESCEFCDRRQMCSGHFERFYGGW